jgi:hypothetical protein
MEPGSSREATVEDGTAQMDESKRCMACGLKLVGPFQPEIAFTLSEPAGPEEAREAGPEVVACAWICPGCGLLQWYAEDEYLAPLLDAAETGMPVTGIPDASYGRRTHMLRMLRRVRRI